MLYDDLPAEVRDILRGQFELEMRRNFLEVEGEIVNTFLKLPDIAPQWVQFREDWFVTELRSYEIQRTWQEWLRERGLSEG